MKQLIAAFAIVTLAFSGVLAGPQTTECEAFTPSPWAEIIGIEQPILTP